MSQLISRTGRVQAWMDDPSGRLPVSCTVMNVANELEGLRTKGGRRAIPIPKQL